MNTPDDFRDRRALRGFGPRKAQLLEDLWLENNMIAHYIVFVAGRDPVQDANRKAAEVERDRIVQELLEITVLKA